MIDLATGHPKFDLAMELLVSVPIEPAWVSQDNLKNDLIPPGKPDAMNQDTVSSLLKRLRRAGFGLLGYHNPNTIGMRVTLLQAQSRFAVDQARTYWETVYGDVG